MSRAAEVAWLAAFVTATQEHHDLLTVQPVINAKAGAENDSQLKHSAAHGFGVAFARPLHSSFGKKLFRRCFQFRLRQPERRDQSNGKNQDSHQRRAPRCRCKPNFGTQVECCSLLRFDEFENFSGIANQPIAGVGQKIDFAIGVLPERDDERADLGRGQRFKRRHGPALFGP